MTNIKNLTALTAAALATAPADHLVAVEWETPEGSRFWSAPMLGAHVNDYVATYSTRIGYEVSDIDCTPECPCVVFNCHDDL